MANQKSAAPVIALIMGGLAAATGLSMCAKAERPLVIKDPSAFVRMVIRTEDRTGACSMQHIGLGVMLTAGHCAIGNEDNPPLAYFWHPVGQDRPRYPLRLLWASKEYDVAMFYSRRAAMLPAVELDCRILDIGDRITLYGLALGEYRWQVPGVIISGQHSVDGIDGEDDKTYKEIVFSNAVSLPGMSGGAALGVDGRIKAIVSIGMGAAVGVVPASTICELIHTSK